MRDGWLNQSGRLSFFSVSFIVVPQACHNEASTSQRLILLVRAVSATHPSLRPPNKETSALYPLESLSILLRDTECRCCCFFPPTPRLTARLLSNSLQADISHTPYIPQETRKQPLTMANWRTPERRRPRSSDSPETTTTTQPSSKKRQTTSTMHTASMPDAPPSLPSPPAAPRPPLHLPRHRNGRGPPVVHGNPATDV